MNSKYSNKIEINRKKLIYNKNKSDLNENNNYFLNGVHLELPNFQENNYQNQFINRKLFTTNYKKRKVNIILILIVMTMKRIKYKEFLI